MTHTSNFSATLSTVESDLQSPSRLRALERSGLLIGSHDPAFDRLTKLMSIVIDVPVALVSIVDVDRQVFVGCIGLPEPWASNRQTPLSHSFCQHVVASGEPLIITDAREHSLVRDNLAIRDLGVIAYAGMPLVTSTGAVLGSFCVIDDHPREWTDREIEILRLLAQSAVTEIELRTSERHAAESSARLDAAMDAAKLGAWSFDVPSSTWWYSSRARAICGIDRESGDAKSLNVRLLALEAADRARITAFIASLRGRNDAYSAQYQVGMPDGTTRHIASTGRVVRDSSGVLQRIVGGVQDETDELQFESARQRLHEAERTARSEAEAARATAEAANRSKSDFLAMMSHELRTPLNAIGGYAELIDMGLRGPVTAEQQLDLARIKRSQRHLLGLIDGVLDYAKIDAGAIEYEIESVPVSEIVAVCESFVAPQLAAKHLTLVHAFDAAPVHVLADRDRLQQIVINVLSNAVKFTNAYGRIEIAWHGGAPSSTVAISVSDTGRGIAADMLPHVFDPFVQVDTSLTRAREGAGLGLAISRDLARGMGGDLTARSVVGDGSVFTLTLPLTPVA